MPKAASARFTWLRFRLSAIGRQASRGEAQSLRHPSFARIGP
jgi:hypothetical protein